MYGPWAVGHTLGAAVGYIGGFNMGGSPGYADAMGGVYTSY